MNFLINWMCIYSITIMLLLVFYVFFQQDGCDVECLIYHLCIVGCACMVKKYTINAD